MSSQIADGRAGSGAILKAAAAVSSGSGDLACEVLTAAADSNASEIEIEMSWAMAHVGLSQ